MQENFLHYIWLHQYFQKSSLQTITGEFVNILNTGSHNMTSGPDFSEARIEIAGLLWTGHVEIHVNASDWNKHKHEKDPAYNNVILHVVWKADKEILRQDGTIPPTIELNQRVEDSLVKKYENLISTPRDVLCENELVQVSNIIKTNMIEKALVSRLERKSLEIMDMLRLNKNDWEETSYQVLARGFGFKANSETFLELSKVLPLRVMYKHADNQFQLEAMLFGQAGLLAGRTKDSYQEKLKKEFVFLKQKHELAENVLKQSIWKIGGLRPANFPTIRIAQLAAVLNQLKSVFSTFINVNSTKELVEILGKSPLQYWNDHYLFGEISHKRSAGLGIESINRLIVNVVAPIKAAYSIHIQDSTYMDQAVSILQQIKPEKNRITRRWDELDLKSSTAAESQGLIELYNSFCLNKSCLTCNIGAAILRKKPAK